MLRKMRRRNDATPVILLTAKDSIEDRVAGLDAGANDYLVKPFAFEELLARIRVLLRKPAEAPKTCYRVGDLEVHMDTQEVSRGGKMIRLSGKEFALLRYMVQNEGIVLSKGAAGAAPVELRLCGRLQCDRRLYPVSAQEDRRGIR